MSNNNTPPNFIDRIGHKYGRLTVIKRLPSRKWKPYWECICECGKTVQVSSGALKTGHTKSCGCSRKKPNLKRRQNLGIRGFNAVYSTYKHQAKRRGVPFELDKPQLKNIIEQNCHYCGSPPSNMSYAGYTPTRIDSKYVYNGIDRVDSSLGYVLNNCVSCCFICNRAKGLSTQSDFLNWAISIAHRFVNASKSTIILIFMLTSCYNGSKEGIMPDTPNKAPLTTIAEYFRGTWDKSSKDDSEEEVKKKKKKKDLDLESMPVPPAQKAISDYFKDRDK